MKNPVIQPIPVSAVWQETTFDFGNVLYLYTDSFFDREADSLIPELWHNFSMTGCTLRLRPGGGRLKANQMAFSVNDELPEMPELPEGESYVLSVTEQGIAIAGCDYSGMMQGFSTLLQVIRARSLKEGEESLYVRCGRVVDHPAIAFRGIHFSIFPDTTYRLMQKMLRTAAIMKFSHIILEFFGSLRLDALPQLAYPNVGFDKAQIRKLITEARVLGVEMIPMINHLGHAAGCRGSRGRHVVLDQNPKLATLFEPDGWEWCISNPETTELLRKIRAELMELFGPGKYFHIGCDEADSYGTCDRCSGQDRNALLKNYLNSICEELAAVGRRPIIWGDMMLDSTKFKAPNTAYSTPQVRTHEILPDLDRRIVIADWQYNLTEGEAVTSQFFKEQGFDVMPASFDVDENVKLLCREADSKKLFGYLCTTWNRATERPRMMSMASEMSWSGANQRVITDDIVYLHFLEVTRKVQPAMADYYQVGLRKYEIDER